MSKRFFYDCPIKAAFMARYHGLKIHGPVKKPTGGIETSTRPMPVWILARAIEAAEKGMRPEDVRYYVAEESLKLLGPQEHDIVLFNGNGANGLTWWPLRFESQNASLIRDHRAGGLPVLLAPKRGSMSDKDREAFEKVATKKRLFLSGSTNPDGTYKGQLTQDAWGIWQSARDHYSPKLTEAEAVTLIGEKASLFGVCGSEGSISRRFGNEVATALRAAGVRFKEEAPSNPEPGSSQ